MAFRKGKHVARHDTLDEQVFFYITSTKKYFHFQKVKSLYTYFFIIVSSNTLVTNQFHKIFK